MNLLIFYSIFLTTADHLGYNVLSTNLAAGVVFVGLQITTLLWHKLTKTLDRHNTQEKVHYEDD